MNDPLSKISVSLAVTKALISSFPDVDPEVIDISNGHETHHNSTGARVMIHLAIPLVTRHLDIRERHRRCVNALKPLVESGVLHSFELHFRVD